MKIQVAYSQPIQHRGLVGGEVQRIASIVTAGRRGACGLGSTSTGQREPPAMLDFADAAGEELPDAVAGLRYGEAASAHARSAAAARACQQVGHALLGLLGGHHAQLRSSSGGRWIWVVMVASSRPAS